MERQLATNAADALSKLRAFSKEIADPQRRASAEIALAALDPIFNDQTVISVRKRRRTSRPEERDMVILMRHRQEEFRQQGPSFYYLSSDASMQRGGQDFQLTLEDSIRMEDTASVLAGDADVFNASGLLKTTMLPAGVLGSADLSGKFELFLSSIKLDIGLDGVGRYSKRILSFCSDYGTEAKFVEVPRQHL
eukprot:s1023_g23.t1